MKTVTHQFKTFKLAKQAEELRKKLCNMKVAGFKTANIGGDTAQGFEQSFAALAYAYIQDKAPRLLDYLIGFQLIDRNEDNTKAIGVFGFKLGKQWVYAPVFFLNGDLKGHELLYLKDQDAFVPMKENWINYLVNRRPHILGEGVDGTSRSLGAGQPNLQNLSELQMSKFSNWLQPCLPMLSAIQVKPSKFFKTAFTGRNILKEIIETSLPAYKIANAWQDKYPFLASAFKQFYPQGFKEPTFIPKAASRILSAAAEKPVEVYTDPDKVTTENIDLTEEDREKLLQDGLLVKDNRRDSEVSVAYNTQLPFKLENPTETGVYEILSKPGKFVKCLVIAQPHTHKDRDNILTLVKLDGDKNWLNAGMGAVWCKNTDQTRESFTEWWDGLADSKPAKRGIYVAVTKDGNGSVPFRIRKDLGEGLYEVAMATGNDYRYSRPEYLPTLATKKNDYPSPVAQNELVQFNVREGTKFRSVNGTLYIPKEAKLIEILQPKENNSSSSDDYVSSYLSNSGSDNASAELLQPGNIADIQLEILQKTAELKIWNDHNEVIVNRKRMSKLAAIVHLIKDHGFREDVAKHMLRESEKRSSVKYRVKYAEPYLTDQGPYSPGIPELGSTSPGLYGVPEMYPQDMSMPVDSMAASNYDQSGYDLEAQPDQQAMQVAQQAAQTGQKDIFDTAMIGSLLKAVRQDSLVDRYLGDLLKALDRLGRILLLFYWHNEEFEERYGKADLPELEDSVRNSFEGLGDLVLFLKAKTVDTFASNMGGEPEVSESARN